MAKTYQVVEEYDINSFEDRLNAFSQDGYAVVSHSIAVDSVNNNTVYSAIIVKYGSGSSDYIQKIMNKLDSIESNTNN